MSLNHFADRLATLADLSQSECHVLRSLPFTVASVQRGRDVATRGQRPDYLYIISEGWAARYALRPDGSRRITAFMLPGDFCGIHAVCHQPLDHSITALTPCAIIRVALSDLEKVIATLPALSRALWQAKLIDEAILRTWMLNSHDAARMLAHLICELHARTQPAIDGPVTLKPPITQEHVGDALGLTSVHVNRMYRKLREDGLLSFDRGTIEVPNIKALQRWAAFDPTYLAPERTTSA